MGKADKLFLLQRVSKLCLLGNDETRVFLEIQQAAELTHLPDTDTGCINFVDFALQHPDLRADLYTFFFAALTERHSPGMPSSVCRQPWGRIPCDVQKTVM